MKNAYGEYYSLDSNSLSLHWEKDIFSFDANVLLNLYRYSPKTRDAFFKVLEQIKDRTWITYQAGLEYHRNRLNVIYAQQAAYDRIRNVLDKKRGEIDAQLNEFKRHPFLEIEQLKRQIKLAFFSIQKELDSLDAMHPDYLKNDPIQDKLVELLEKRFGNDFSLDELEDIYKEGKDRFEKEVPPGYKDLGPKKSKGERSIYGDLILWKQVINKANDVPESIILITDDLKDDWWYRFKGKTIGPRVALIKEFQNATGKRINIYQADKFLSLANEYLGQNTQDEAIQEIENLRHEDLKSLEAPPHKPKSKIQKYILKFEITDYSINRNKIKYKIAEQLMAYFSHVKFITILPDDLSLTFEVETKSPDQILLVTELFKDFKWVRLALIRT